jgi:F-type H+-transporting ATPase subunit a
MEKLEHALWIVQAVNALFGAPVAALLGMIGITVDPAHEVIPNYIVMSLLILVGLGILAVAVRTRLSVDNPGRFQIFLEMLVGGVVGLLDENIGPKGRKYLPLIGAVGLFILVGNLMGLVPGLMAPTSNINVTLGCAITVWVYYQFHGFREQGVVAYLKHFAAPPGAPMWIAPIYFPIEIISHLSRVLSLSVRLFGNIFGEELVILILFTIVPFVVPLPMMFLGIVTSTLQAFIFVMLTIIYLAGAVAVEHGDHGAGHGHGETHEPAAA